MTIKYTIRLYKAEELVYKLTTSKRGKIPIRLKAYEFDQCYLRVIYNESGAINEGWYATEAEAMEALNAFCVPELLDYVANPRKVDEE